jgi:hypothetical protein
MGFQNTDLEAICKEIRQMRLNAGRLSLVEFNDAEYDVLLDGARRIARRRTYRWSLKKRKCARLTFLAFTMAFVRRNKYTADNVFWPDFEAVLRLDTMEHRYRIMDDLLWPAYGEEGIERSRDDRGRRIVGTLVDEMSEARTWVTQARKKFIEFFQWYYQQHPDEKVSPKMLDEYRQATGKRIQVFKKVLPTLTQDCQALTRVIDYAIENDLYLRSQKLEEYRAQVTEALGETVDPTQLRLIHDERSLVKLIRELQNHCTPFQFEEKLQQHSGGTVRAPWGAKLNTHAALRRWKPFSYGIYKVDGEEYRVVPHRRLRLETLQAWPKEQVVHWRGQRYLGYKKSSPFQATVGRRTVDAKPYVRSRHKRWYIWFGEVPTGQKFAIDGRLRPESAGADWNMSLHLTRSRGDNYGLHLVITRLMLYYPHQAHYPVRIWANTGYEYEDSLRSDGVRRFHLHPRLIIPLEGFKDPIVATVRVGDKAVLSRSLEPQSHYLFSLSNREQVGGRNIADVGDLDYVLFSRDTAAPQCGPGIRSRQLPKPFGEYVVHQITWEDPSQPFDVRVGKAHWLFQRRREFTAILESSRSYEHLRLKPHQCLHFQDLSLRLYSTSDVLTAAPTMEICGVEGVIDQIDLAPYLGPANVDHFFDVAPTIWDNVERLVAGEYGRYVLRFLDEETLLDQTTVSLIPPLELVDWDRKRPYPETKPLALSITSPDSPIWNPESEQVEAQATLQLHPKTRAEPWQDHPRLRRIASEQLAGLVSFPELGETAEITVRPRLFGFRLYLRHWEHTSNGKYRPRYQPVSQVDYYQVDETVLHIFSAPQAAIVIKTGALDVIAEETDEEGDLLIESLSDLQPACLRAKTEFTIHSGKLQAVFTVRWAPILHALTVQGEEAVLRFNGPRGTFIRLWLREAKGDVVWKEDIPCVGEEVTEHLALSSQRPPLSYLTAGYVLGDGSVRSAVAQAKIGSGMGMSIPSEWLTEGIGVACLEDLQT